MSARGNATRPHDFAEKKGVTRDGKLRGLRAVDRRMANTVENMI